jgi:transcriptional regulator with AAA-type ATPase domain
MGDEHSGRDSEQRRAGGEQPFFYALNDASPLPRLKAASLASRRTGAAFLVPSEAGDMRVLLSIGDSTNEHARIERGATQVSSPREVWLSAGDKVVPPHQARELEIGEGGIYLPWPLGERMNGLLYVGLEDPHALELPELDGEAQCGFSAHWLSVVAALLSLGEDSGLSGQVSSNVGGLIGSCPAMLKVFRDIGLYAKLNFNVLIAGETGTGKELVAGALVSLSKRADKPFLKLNCGSFLDTLLLSELFGHERGAFTGAVKRQVGKFELANGGTLFLDEVGELSPAAQVALLRVLQMGEFSRLGSDGSIKCDVRVICATHRNLEQMIEAGTFRQDLYERLNQLRIEIPPLRSRGADILVLADAMLRKVAGLAEMPQRGFTPRARTKLLKAPWPGNVRQLENVIRQALVQTEGLRAIDVEDLPLGHAAARGSTLDAQKMGRFLASFIDRLERAYHGDSREAWESAVYTALTERGPGPSSNWIPILREKLEIPEEARSDHPKRLSHGEAAKFTDHIMSLAGSPLSVDALAAAAATYLLGSPKDVDSRVAAVRGRLAAARNDTSPEHRSAMSAGTTEAMRKGLTP